MHQILRFGYAKNAPENKRNESGLQINADYP
jgi:hypothetical protein